MPVPCHSFSSCPLTEGEVPLRTEYNYSKGRGNNAIPLVYLGAIYPLSMRSHPKNVTALHLQATLAPLPVRYACGARFCLGCEPLAISWEEKRSEGLELRQCPA